MRNKKILSNIELAELVVEDLQKDKEYADAKKNSTLSAEQSILLDLQVRVGELDFSKRRSPLTYVFTEDFTFYAFKQKILDCQDPLKLFYRCTKVFNDQNGKQDMVMQFVHKKPQSSSNREKKVLDSEVLCLLKDSTTKEKFFQKVKLWVKPKFQDTLISSINHALKLNEATNKRKREDALDTNPTPSKKVREIKKKSDVVENFHCLIQKIPKQKQKSPMKHLTAAGFCFQDFKNEILGKNEEAIEVFCLCLASLSFQDAKIRFTENFMLDKQFKNQKASDCTDPRVLNLLMDSNRRELLLQSIKGKGDFKIAGIIDNYAAKNKPKADLDEKPAKLQLPFWQPLIPVKSEPMEIGIDETQEEKMESISIQ